MSGRRRISLPADADCLAPCWLVTMSLGRDRTPLLRVFRRQSVLSTEGRNLRATHRWILPDTSVTVIGRVLAQLVAFVGVQPALPTE
jgi:hypothetical protein